MVGHNFMGGIHPHIPSLLYKHQYRSNLLESHQLAISGGKFTLFYCCGPIATINEDIIPSIGADEGRQLT